MYIWLNGVASVMSVSLMSGPFMPVESMKLVAALRAVAGLTGVAVAVRASVASNSRQMRFRFMVYALFGGFVTGNYTRFIERLMVSIFWSRASLAWSKPSLLGSWPLTPK